ncbi:macrophage mannose receptor 1-like [Xyrichtys novacula]|uniref:Macrophage mannose receptor 1-like n=1 Tax=Xyrichtys novacula TaxID=13765 RepID=A0AAV1HIF2_XYRNO|nr:macrophage mannose receptor 1-like [Xyrichtys novacula]
MKKIIFFIVFCTAVEEGSGEHIFVSLEKTWYEAQAYCREKYTDLSFITSQSEQNRLQAASGQNITTGWIGLHKESINSSVWKWSGGEHITYQNWGYWQPDNYNGRESVVQIWYGGKWNDFEPSFELPFYCISVTAVQVRRTWEEALEHCRETDTDLASLHSEWEMHQVLSGIQHDHITEGVWIGLRFLGDRWLWLDGGSMLYEAWPEGEHQDYQCPIQKRCGALTKGGRWGNWDCEEKLNFICN